MMRFQGNVYRSGKHWLAEVPVRLVVEPRAALLGLARLVDPDRDRP